MARLALSYPTFRQPKEVIHGSGARKMLARLDGLANTAIFLSGRRQTQELIQAVLGDRLPSLPADPVCLKPPGEPNAEMIRAGADFLARGNFQRILGIGGGSVLDWCRLSWARLAGLLPQTPQNMANLNAPVANPPVFWLVPTTCATGAEATGVAVLRDSGGRKVPVACPHFVADRVILDGKFLEEASEATLANWLCDAMSHAIEGFLSLAANPFVEDAAVGALQRIFAATGEARSSSRNDRLMAAAYLGGLATGNASAGVIHAFAHTAAALGISHSHANALGLLAGLDLNADVPRMSALLDRLRMDQGTLCDRVGAIVRAALSGEDRALATQLRAAGLRRSVCAAMATDFCLRTNPKRPTETDLMKFLDKVVQTIESQ